MFGPGVRLKNIIFIGIERMVALSFLFSILKNYILHSVLWGFYEIAPFISFYRILFSEFVTPVHFLQEAPCIGLQNLFSIFSP